MQRQWTWTAYPSLLSSLSTDEQRLALERAAAALYCGRLHDAESIFDSELPSFATQPIVALQRADMLNMHGMEHERIKLLETTLAAAEGENNNDNNIDLLLQFMLADAKFWAFGIMQEALDLLPRIRQALRKRGLSNLCDVEIRCATLFHTVVDAFRDQSNFIAPTDICVFEGFNGDLHAELKSLREDLQSRNEWRLAATLMQLELNNTPASGMQGAVIAGLRMCDVLTQPTMPLPLHFRSAVLKRSIATTLERVMPPMAAQLHNQVKGILSSICPDHFRSWEDYVPVMAADMSKSIILKSTNSTSTKLEELRQLAERTISQGNFTMTNRINMTILNVAEEWYLKSRGTPDAPEALSSLQNAHESFQNLHRDRTRMAFFDAAAVIHYMSFLSIRYHDFATVILELEAFAARQARFEIPRMLERAYDLATGAARHLNLGEKKWIFSKKRKQSLRLCNFREDGEYVDNRISDREAVQREIITEDETFVEWGLNAMKVLLHWAAGQVEKAQMSPRQCQLLFGPEMEALTTQNAQSFVNDEVEVSNVGRFAYGPVDQPNKSRQFWKVYNRIQDWALASEQLASLDARLFVLMVIARSRGQRVRLFFIQQNSLPTALEAQTLLEETGTIDRIVRLEAAQNGSVLTGGEHGAWVSIHKTLLKCFAISSPGAKLIQANELEIAISQCQELIRSHHQNQNWVHEYSATTKLLELHWQQYVHFCSLDPMDIMPYAEKAEELFVKIRKLINNLDTSDDLVASAKMSEEYFQRQHYEWAFAALVAAFDSQHYGVVKGKETSVAEELVQWSVRAKGRAFADAMEIAQNSEHSVEPSTEGRSLNDLMPLREALEVSDASVNIVQDKSNVFLEAIKMFPSNVVVVDFIYLSYAQAGARVVAIVHRREQATSVIKMPDVDQEKIDKWVLENLDAPRVTRHNELYGKDSGQHLEQLSGLLGPLLVAEDDQEAIIKANDIVIICPTGSLNRVPIHAIPVDGKSLIERNAVVYTHSLTLLSHLWQQYLDRPAGDAPKHKRTLINPMPALWPSGDPVKSSTKIPDLAHDIDATLRSGFSLQKAAVLESVKDAALFHYHGHINSSPASALDATMLLNEAAFTRSIGPNRETLTPRDFFKIRLAPLALSVLIGCGSGVSLVSKTDDVLGWSTAQFFAGAGAVVSSLWPIEDEDGIAFAEEFYAALRRSERFTESVDNTCLRLPNVHSSHDEHQTRTSSSSAQDVGATLEPSAGPLGHSIS
ncbi:MAG: hypothetical protein Q9159_004485 [Coniocarpon cinnabarinum]